MQLVTVSSHAIIIKIRLKILLLLHLERYPGPWRGTLRNTACALWESATVVNYNVFKVDC